MAASVREVITPTSLTTNGSSISATTSSAVQAGDILLMVVTETNFDTVSFNTPTGSSGVGTFTLRIDGSAYASYRMAAWTAPVTTAGAKTVTATTSNASLLQAQLIVIQNVASVDVSAAGNGTGTSQQAPSVTTTAANDLLVCVFMSRQNAGTFTALPSGMTQIAQTVSGSTYRTLTCSAVQASAGASGTKTATFSASNTFNTGTIAFKAGTIAFSGSATGTIKLAAGRSGVKRATGTRTGTVKLAAARSGAKRGSLAPTPTVRLQASSSGVKRAAGAATATVRLVATREGHKVNLGTATIRLTAAIVSASRPGSGHVTAGLRLSASATSAPRHASGAATATVKLVATPVGAKRRTGTVTATVKLVAARVGAKRVPGTRTATVRLLASEAGTKRVPATRTAVLKLATSLSGRFHVSGSARTAVLKLRASPTGTHVTVDLTGRTATIRLRGSGVGKRIVAEVVAPLRPTASLAIAYELVCVGRIPQTSGAPTFLQIDPIDWTGLSYVDELSKPQQLNAGVSISSLTEPVLQRLRDLSDLATELWLYRQGRLVFAGPLLGWQVQGETLTLNASGLLSYLKMMVVDSDQVFSQVDQISIATKLVDQWQSLDYGNFGIDTTGIPPSGVLRDATYLQKELHNVYQRVTELGARENGFDISVDPQSRKLRLTYPLQGVDRSTGEDAIVFDARNVTSPNIICSSAPGDVASESYGTGTSSGSDTIYTVESNLELRARYGRSAYAANYDGVSEQSTLDDHAEGALEARSEALLIPGPDTRVTPDADLSQYDVGDTVNYQLHEQLSIQGAFRIRKRTVTVSKTGQETVSLAFA